MKRFLFDLISLPACRPAGPSISALTHSTRPPILSKSIFVYYVLQVTVLSLMALWFRQVREAEAGPSEVVDVR